VRDFGTTHMSDLDRISRQISLLTGTNLKDQVISKLSPSFLSSAVNIWSDYVISDMSLVEAAQLSHKDEKRQPCCGCTAWRFSCKTRFDLSVPVDVYNWDADWLRNWYIKTLEMLGKLLPPV